MAQAFVQEPKEVSLTDNELIFTFYEGGAVSGSNLFDTSTNTDFRFRVDLYVSGDLYSQQEVYIQQQVSSGGFEYAYAKYDASNILKILSSHNKRTLAVESTGIYLEYYIKITPLYTASGTPTVGSTTTSSTRWAVKGKLTKKDWIDYVDNDLFLTSYWATSNGWQFFTQFPRTEKYWVALDEECYLLANTNGEYINVYIKLYDSSGTLITSTTHTFATIDRSLFINCSPSVIISDTAITSTHFSTCAYYTIQTEEDTGGYLSEEFTFWIDVDCERFTNVRLYFLAKTGTIEAFTFKLMSRERTNTQRSSGSKIWGEFDSTGAYNFDLEKGERFTNLIQETSTIEINSDWISEAVQNWLVKNLYTSPYIIMEKEGVFQRVLITDTTFEEKKRKNDLLIMETITLEYSQDNSSPVI